jgi:hypothetical protein
MSGPKYLSRWQRENFVNPAEKATHHGRAFANVADDFRDLLTRGRKEALCFSVSVEHLSLFVA